jgi:hypothetical protein
MRNDRNDERLAPEELAALADPIETGILEVLLRTPAGPRGADRRRVMGAPTRRLDAQVQRVLVAPKEPARKG